MTRTLSRSSAFTALALVATVGLPAWLATAPGAALAQEKTVAARVTDTKTAERIEMVSGIRALGQRVAASLCLAHAGIDADANTKVAAAAMEDLAGLIDVAENGSEALGRGPEDDRRVQGAINGMKANWNMFAEHVNALIAGQDMDANYDFLSRQNLNMSYASRDFLVRLMQVYVQPPELLQSYALTLDIASRQRALTQQMAKEACGLATDNPVMGNVLRIQNAARLFDLSMAALRDGFAAAGVISPPSPEIADAIKGALADWDAVKPKVLSITSLGALSPAEAGEIFTKLDALSKKLQTVSGLYVKASKFKG